MFLWFYVLFLILRKCYGKVCVKSSNVFTEKCNTFLSLLRYRQFIWLWPYVIVISVYSFDCFVFQKLILLFFNLLSFLSGHNKLGSLSLKLTRLKVAYEKLQKLYLYCFDYSVLSFDVYFLWWDSHLELFSLNLCMYIDYALISKVQDNLQTSERNGVQKQVYLIFQNIRPKFQCFY